jgi:hypothetical protein
MPKIDYPRVIEDDPRELDKLEKRHRYSHLFHRVKMLRLLKSEECSNLGEAAEALGYSPPQCQRWFITYRREGLEELLVSRVGERGPTELITQEVFEELERGHEQWRDRHYSPGAWVPLAQREECTTLTPRASGGFSGAGR